MPLPGFAIQALTDAAMEHLQRRLVVRYVVSDIELHAEQRKLPDGNVWWDVRPMVSKHENPPEFVDMAKEALDYALATGICVQHTVMPHLVRIAIDPEA